MGFTIQFLNTSIFYIYNLILQLYYYCSADASKYAVVDIDQYLCNLRSNGSISYAHYQQHTNHVIKYNFIQESILNNIIIYT